MAYVKEGLAIAAVHNNAQHHACHIPCASTYGGCATAAHDLKLEVEACWERCSQNAEPDVERGPDLQDNEDWHVTWTALETMMIQGKPMFFFKQYMRRTWLPKCSMGGKKDRRQLNKILLWLCNTWHLVLVLVCPKTHMYPSSKISHPLRLAETWSGNTTDIAASTLGFLSCISEHMVQLDGPKGQFAIEWPPNLDSCECVFLKIIWCKCKADNLNHASKWQTHNTSCTGHCITQHHRFFTSVSTLWESHNDTLCKQPCRHAAVVQNVVEISWKLRRHQFSLIQCGA